MVLPPVIIYFSEILSLTTTIHFIWVALFSGNLHIHSGPLPGKIRGPGRQLREGFHLPGPLSIPWIYSAQGFDGEFTHENLLVYTVYNII